jgi:hypothetical protein
MRICTQINKRTSVAGISRGKYATKDTNVKKLKVYLNKIENGS